MNNPWSLKNKLKMKRQFHLLKQSGNKYWIKLLKIKYKDILKRNLIKIIINLKNR